MAVARPAQAAGPSPIAQSALADRLTNQLGDQQAGSYLDGTGNLVVNVTSKAAAKQVTDAGAIAHVVKHGMKPLNATKAKLDKLAGTKGAVGMAWAVDVFSNSVVVKVPRSDNDAATKALIKRFRAMGETVRIERVAGGPRLTHGPGDPIDGGGFECSMGAVGVRDGVDYLITAGHCTRLAESWTTPGGQPLGTRDVTSFPGDDYGTIRSAGQVPLDNGGLTQVGRPPLGSQIQKKGAQTGTTTGSIVAYNVTLTFDEGEIRDAIATTACMQPGDSGGSLQAGNTAIGIAWGTYNGPACTNPGFWSLHQPLDTVLQKEGLTLK